MNLYLFTFIFNMASIIGWCIEIVYRRFFAPSRKWYNPGFSKGPYLPMYGFGAGILYFSSIFIKNKLYFVVFTAFLLTGLEYITGLIFIKKYKQNLWDYSHNFANVNGLICPLYSSFWIILSSIYCYFLHPLIMDYSKIFLQNTLLKISSLCLFIAISCDFFLSLFRVYNSK